ncbi:1-acyl-sn-glycerol-3-phosphate acyltransferase beta isoform X2 [Frankliniella occidentalis]|uniref:1-acyl-sn-glycerol-3-phosphate acyltransferase n=2 Tax=Frankliniella occidentalis TaxID=133901 RepID=A0A9C6U3X7_FRAOC|nr:1-acyl-sn-glycerol-3-phosphate acyltransferase beta isoform X1 [Frankliniella occidentalis]XP_052121224.1 1-acyl-sn-glycerol-3-phosphate acyltransferase beta isoform X2 [Frankliniella occidentalis]
MSAMGSLDALAAVVLLMVLCSTSRVVRYYIKWAVFVVWSTVSACAPIPLMLLDPLSWKNALYPARSLRVLTRLFGIHMEVSGTENIVDSGCVVLLNHQSLLDLHVLAELWVVMERCAVIAKREIFWLWPFGLASWLWGTIFIDRLNPEKSQKTINSTGDRVRKERTRLLLFPEGTRHGGTTLLPFKKGAFHVAIASQTAIQPVVVSRYHFLDYDKCKYDAGTVLIKILPAISTKGMTRDDLPAVLERTQAVMQEEYARLNMEVLKMDAKAMDDKYVR